MQITRTTPPAVSGGVVVTPESSATFTVQGIGALVISPLTLIAPLTSAAPTRTPLPAGNQRTGSVQAFSPLTLIVPTSSPLRRATTDLGYGGAIITGSVFGGGAIAPPGVATKVSFYPGANYVGVTTTQRVDTGIAANADVAPVITVRRNGAVVSGFLSLTHPPAAAGEYVITGTIPGTFAVGDVLNFTVQATVNGVAAKYESDALVLGSPPPTTGLVFP